MTSVTARERNLLIATITLAVLVILHIAVIRPTLHSIRRMRTKVSLSVQEFQRMRSVASRKSEVESAYEEIRSRITSTKSAEREIIDMLLAVEKAAVNAGVEVVQNVHRDDKPFEYFNRHTVSFTGIGKAPDLTAMLFALQDPQALLKVPKAKFAVKNHQIEMELEITRVIYKSEEDND